MNLECSYIYCTSTAKYICRCKARTYLCKEHMQDHFDSGGRHAITLSYLRLTSQEENTLDGCIGLLTRAFKQNKSSSPEDFSDRYYAMIRNLWVMVRKRAIPLATEEPFLIELALFKRENGFLTQEALLAIFRSFGFDCGLNSEAVVDKSFFSVQLREKYLRILDTNTTIIEISHPSFSIFGACLITDTNRILVTMDAEAFEIRISEREAVPVARLNHSRHDHAMTWIGPFPAVMGGMHLDSMLKSVEVYSHDKWVNYPRLNLKRAGIAACSLSSGTYVMGGFYVTKCRTKAIEKFSQGRWTILDLQLPFLSNDFSVSVVDNKILTFGGSYNSSKVWNIDLESGKTKKLSSWKCFFCKSILLKRKNKLVTLQNHNIIKYSL